MIVKKMWLEREVRDFSEAVRYLKRGYYLYLDDGRIIHDPAELGKEEVYG